MDLRRTTRPKPTNPAPKSAHVEGSGTGVTLEVPETRKLSIRLVPVDAAVPPDAETVDLSMTRKKTELTSSTAPIPVRLKENPYAEDGVVTFQLALGDPPFSRTK